MHKEIHLRLSYISSVASKASSPFPSSSSFTTTSSEALKHEVLGVITHEMTHVWQHDGEGTTPGGLIEGIADFVRLNAGLGAAHWKREVKEGQEWDAGYQDTGYFLDWLERERCGKGTVRAVNGWLGRREYDEEGLWGEVCGGSVGELWGEYVAWLGKQDGEVGHGRRGRRADGVR